MYPRKYMLVENKSGHRIERDSRVTILLSLLRSVKGGVGLSQESDAHLPVRVISERIGGEGKRDERDSGYGTAEAIRRSGSRNCATTVQLYGDQSGGFVGTPTVRRRSDRSNARRIVPDRRAACRNRLLCARHTRDSATARRPPVAAYPGLRDGALEHVSEGRDQSLLETQLHPGTRHGAGPAQSQRGLQLLRIERREGQANETAGSPNASEHGVERR